MRTAFKKQFGESEFPIEYFYSPTVLQLLGDHTEYAGGTSMLMAVEWGIYAAVRLRSDNHINFATMGLHEEVKLASAEDVNLLEENQVWANPTLRIFQYIAKREGFIHGVDIMFFNALNYEIDLSLSPILEILTAYITLYLKYKNKVNRDDIRSICREVNPDATVQHQFTQAAAITAKHAHVVLFDSKSMKSVLEPINLGPYELVLLALPNDVQLPASLIEKRRDEAGEALAAIQKHHPIQYLCDAQFKDMVYLDDELLSNRAMHCIAENIKVEEALNVLRENYIEHLGKLFTTSHKSILKDCEMKSEMHDQLVEESILIDGCIGAKMVQINGYLYVLAMVHGEAIEAFKAAVSDRFYKQTNLRILPHSLKISDGVKRV